MIRHRLFFMKFTQKTKHIKYNLFFYLNIQHGSYNYLIK